MDIALGSPQHSQINFKGHDCSSGLAVPHSNWPPHPGLRGIRLSVFTVALGTLLPNTKIPISLCKASLQLWKSSQKRLVTDTNQTAGPVSALNYWYSTIVNLSHKWGGLDLQLPLPAPEHQGGWSLSATNPNWSQNQKPCCWSGVSVWFGHCKVYLMTAGKANICVVTGPVQQIVVLHTREAILRKPEAETSDWCWQLNLICESVLLSITFACQ